MYKNMESEKENNILKALSLYEKGIKIPEILTMFPKEKKELKGIFENISLLNNSREEIKPSQALLKKILERVPSQKENSYSSSAIQTQSSFFDTHMNKWSYLISGGAVVAIALVFVLNQPSSGTQGEVATQDVATLKSAVMSEPYSETPDSRESDGMTVESPQVFSLRTASTEESLGSTSTSTQFFEGEPATNAFETGYQESPVVKQNLFSRIFSTLSSWFVNVKESVGL